MTGVIYVLSDPRHGEIRYVGWTVRPRVRLRQHISDKHKSVKASWIKQLVLAGTAPVMTIVQTLPSSVREDAGKRSDKLSSAGRSSVINRQKRVQREFSGH